MNYLEFSNNIAQGKELRIKQYYKMINRVNSIRYTNNNPYIRNNVSFKSNSRHYIMDNGKSMETYTCFFRDDFPWNDFIPFIQTHFKNKEKVNIINAACSDGTEALSLIMLLHKYLKSDCKKFLPIIAYDIDDEILKAANSGYILLNGDEIYELKKRVGDYEKYLKEDSKTVLDIKDNDYNTKVVAAEDISLRPIQKKDSGSIIKLDNLLVTNNLNNTSYTNQPIYSQSTLPRNNATKLIKSFFQSTYKINKNVLEQISFKYGDIFEILENYIDDGNTILMFRNALGHLGNEKSLAFAKLAKSKLKPGSLLSIGAYDAKNCKIKKHLIQNGFTEIMENIYRRDNLYQTITKFIVKLKFVVK